MAEAVLSLVIDSVGPWLAHEAKLLRGVDTEISQVIQELRSIQSYIKDADEKAEKEALNYGAKNWVNQLREVAYQIEDVTDSYVLHMATETPCNHCRPSLLGCLGRAMCSILRLNPRHQIAQDIIQVKERIHAIKEMGQTYGFRSVSSELEASSRRNDTWHDPRVTSLFIEEAEVVGIEAHRDKLVGWLVNGGSKRTVISIVGMGGLGKTTLARKVYDTQIVTNHFSHQAWITVSQTFKVEELLRKTLKHFYTTRKESPPPQIDNMEETQLITELREYLKTKRYMVVFDDIWAIEFWSQIQCALPDNGQCSRVLITTRSDQVASLCKRSLLDQVYRLQSLPEEKGLELFRKKVFYTDIEDLPSELELLSRSIVKRCEGLPLAIVTIAGMLSTKRKVVSEWQELEKNLGSELSTNPHFSNMNWILSLSYYDLPFNLKLCLMYFGMLPEDYSIRHARLIRLWIAEGFVKESRGKTAEHVAKEYLAELINRSLVQVSRLDIDGKIRTVRVHDLMREIFLSKSEDLSYGHVWAEDNLTYNKEFTRRVSIHRCINNNDLKRGGKFGTRSLSVFDVDNLRGPVLLALMNIFKLLKVLDLQDSPIDFLPEEVGDLFLLRYLSLRNTKTKKLPKSVGKLHNLQTLDLKATFIHELPAEIKHLINLLYLIGYNYNGDDDFSVSAQKGFKLNQGLGCLQKLQKLYLVEANHGITLFKELRKLKQLRKLGITKLATQNGKILCESIASMSHLESLEVCSEEEEMLDLQFISSPPQYLQRLYLKGRLKKVPDWIPKLKNLFTVSLMWSGLTTNPLDILQDLPYLSELVLQDAFLGEELVFQATGFQKLKILKLYDMNTLTKLTIEKGAIPILELLKIGPIPRLNNLPTGIHHLKKLSALRFYDVSKEFALKLVPDEGEDFWVVEHIQTVLFHYQIQGEHYKTLTLNDLIFLNH